MYREICAATLPIQSLAKTLDNWGEIARGLAEPKRKRNRYAYHYVNAYGVCPDPGIFGGIAPVSNG